MTTLIKRLPRSPREKEKRKISSCDSCGPAGGLHTHASSIRVAGEVLGAGTAETAYGVGTGRIGAARFTQALVDVCQWKMKVLSFTGGETEKKRNAHR